jgi:hypothetical protein
MIWDSNWLNGGNYTLYMISRAPYSMHGSFVINTRFGRDYRHSPLRVGHGIFNLQISGNVWDDTDLLMDINDYIRST